MKLLISFLFLCFLVHQPAAAMAHRGRNSRRRTSSSRSRNSPLNPSSSTTQHSPPFSPVPRSLPLPSHPPPPAYHHIQFVQLWPPTYCKDADCRPNYGRKFHTHGIWPADSYGDSLKNCKGIPSSMSKEDISRLYMRREDKEDLHNLVVNWPSIVKKYDNENFWAHEWTDHGVCSSNVFSPKAYFRKVAYLTGKINLLDILEKAGITPGLSVMYTRDEIKTTIEKALDPSIKIRITCLNKNDNTGIFLREVYICMDPSAKNYIKCPSRGDNCGSKRNIRFPDK